MHDLCFGSRFHKTLGLFLLALDAGCGQAAVQAGPTPGLGDAGTGVGSKDAGATLNIIPSSDDASIGSVDLAPPTDLPPPLTDFPSAPVLDGANVPANAPDLAPAVHDGMA